MKRLYRALRLSLIVALFLVVGCSSEGTEEANSQSIEANMSAVVDVQMKEVLDGYLQIKDALVQTDGKTAGQAAQALAKLLVNETEGVLGDIHFDARQIAGMADADDQRVQFESLSNNMYTLMKDNADVGIPVYQQYCPMAFDNQGAAWLAVEKEVNNPYFGDRMLHCGSVQEEL
ncbi:MAG: DUF3347 domain-containing protein [Bacteroidota bacterium]